MAEDFTGDPAVRASSPVDFAQITRLLELLMESAFHGTDTSAVRDNDRPVNIPKNQCAFGHGLRVGPFRGMGQDTLQCLPVDFIRGCRP